MSTILDNIKAEIEVINKNMEALKVCKLLFYKAGDSFSEQACSEMMNVLFYKRIDLLKLIPGEESPAEKHKRLMGYEGPRP